MSLRGCKRIAREAVGVVEHDHHAAHREGCHQGAEKLVALLHLGRRAEPVTYLEVGDEAAGHGERRAHHAAHQQRGHDAGRAAQAHSHHYHGGQDERHQRHARHRIAAHDGDGVGRHGGEQEGYQGHQQDAHNGVKQIATHHAEEEEAEHYDQRERRTEDDDLHGDILLCALGGLLGIALLRHLAAGQRYGAGHYLAALDDADDAGHGDGADTDGAGVGEEHLRRCLRGGHCAGARAGGYLHVGEQERYARHDDPPHQHAAGAYHGRIFQAYDISHAQHGGAGIELEDKLGLVGYHIAQRADAACELLIPETEGRHCKVVETADDAGLEQQHQASRAAALAGDKYLSRGRGLGEGILAVHVAHKIFTEGDEEEYAERSAQERGEEHLYKVDRDIGILGLEDVQGRQGEYSACHHAARACADALDDHVLAHGAAAACDTAQTYGNDGDGDGGLKDLPHLEPQIGRGGREDNDHHQSPRHRPCVGLARMRAGRHKRLVGLAFFQFSKRVFRELGSFLWL